MKFKYFAAVAAIAIGSMASSVSAGTITATTGATPLALGAVPGQDFETELGAVGADTLYSGPLSLVADKDVRLTFSLVGHESAFANQLLLDGNKIIEETSSGKRPGNVVGDFATDVLTEEKDGVTPQQFTMKLLSGEDLATRLSFYVVDTDTTFTAAEAAFGIFLDVGTDVTSTSVNRFYLALDDGGGSPDDNHDDIIIRVDVAPIPLPAGGLLLMGGLAGFAALRRRKKA